MDVTRRLVGIVIVMATLLACVTPRAHAQRPTETTRERAGRLARGSAGVRLGTWKVDVQATDTSELSHSLHYEVYLQRGLEEHLALENSIAIWRRVTQEVQTLPLGGERIVETKSYVVPVLTALKFYPITTPSNFFDPYIAGGVGFGLGIISEAENAIGGGGISITTGFGVRTAVGVEIHLTRMLGVVAAGRYQWLRFSKDLGSKDVFNGAGIDGGITYRFRY